MFYQHVIGLLTCVPLADWFPGLLVHNFCGVALLSYLVFDLYVIGRLLCL